MQMHSSSISQPQLNTDPLDGWATAQTLHPIRSFPSGWTHPFMCIPYRLVGAVYDARIKHAHQRG